MFFGDVYFIELIVLHTVGCVQSCFWSCEFFSYRDCHLSNDMLISECNEIFIENLKSENNRIK